jgi:hypothetical protein
VYILLFADHQYYEKGAFLGSFLLIQFSISFLVHNEYARVHELYGC